MAVKKFNINAYRRQYVARFLLEKCKQRAKKHGVPFSITEHDIVIPAVCPALGIELRNFMNPTGPTDNSATVDRIDPSKGYVPGNIAVISKLANQIKSNATSSDIMKVAKWLKGLTRRPRPRKM